MFHGTKDEAGCGRWEPLSWPSPQHDETASQGEKEAGGLKEMVGTGVKFPKCLPDRRQKPLRQMAQLERYS